MSNETFNWKQIKPWHVVAIIAIVAFIFIERYEVVPVNVERAPAAYKLDKWTGIVLYLIIDQSKELKHRRAS